MRWETGDEQRHTVSPEVLDASEGGLSVSNGSIHVVLLAVLVDTEALKVNIPTRAELGLHGAGDVNWALHVEMLDAALHDAELHCDASGHLNGAAEADFAVALAEMQVSDTEFGARNVNGEVDFAAAGQVLDIAVSAVLGTAGNGACAFLAYFLLDAVVGAAGMHVDGLWGFGDIAVHVCAGCYQLTLSAVPFCQDFGAGCAAEDSGMDQAGKSDVRDVAGGAEDAFKIPDGFCTG